MSLSDNRGTFMGLDTAGFRTVADAALERFGDELAGFVWAEALADYRTSRVVERMAAARVSGGRPWKKLAP